MAGGHGGSTTYKGVTLHHPKRWHTITGKGMCAMMWVGDILGRAMKIIPLVTDMNMSEMKGRLVIADRKLAKEDGERTTTPAMALVNEWGN
ncbi:hypothetical protein L1049_026404 [Liquidambar formosana]|uniref:Uncharacterized protein n=1 Tax=Liquidambar formosana TaxID=63359 RepID=A0AAP0NDL8_LIQFO